MLVAIPALASAFRQHSISSDKAIHDRAERYCHLLITLAESSEPMMRVILDETDFVEHAVLALNQSLVRIHQSSRPSDFVSKINPSGFGKLQPYKHDFTLLLFFNYVCIFLQHYRIHMDIGNSKNYLGLMYVYGHTRWVEIGLGLL